MSLPEITESYIKSSLVKGELINKIRAKDILIISSSINLLEFDEEQRELINSAYVGLPQELAGTNPNTQCGPLTGGGDLYGDYPDVAVVGINNVPIASGSPSHGDAIVYDSFTNKWIYSNIGSGGLNRRSIQMSAVPPSGGTFTKTLSPAMPDTNYDVFTETSYLVGYYVTNKTTNSFDLVVGTGVGGNINMQIIWRG